MARKVKAAVDMGCEVAIVLGGGNIFRGATGALSGIDRSSGDYMGMLATIINALALQNGLEKEGMPTRVMTAIDMPRVAEPMILRRALRHLEKGRVVIFAGGTGNPYFSTDTGAALRASEIHADALLKATKVDGVYTADPKKDPAARRYSTLNYRTALDRQLKVMDSTAFAMCMDNSVPIVVFDFFDEGALEKVIAGKGAGTIVADVEDSF
jgi:uridylate kinase